MNCTYGVRFLDYTYKMGNLFQMYNFSEVSTYIGYAVGYLLIAAILIAFSVLLYKKQEISKKGFYFSFGRYLFNGWICMMFTLICLYFSITYIGRFVITAAGLLLFFGLNYAMNPNRRKLRTDK